MASTRTPATGTIKMSDLDKSVVQGWTSNTTPQSLQRYATEDFNPGSPPNGFAYCYGNPGTSTPHRLSTFYDLLGWVNYVATAINVNNVGNIRVEINPMNGSNGTAPNPITLDSGTGSLPNGSFQEEGAHWETLQFVVSVAGMTGGSFDVYFDGSYIDTILTDGIYVYDNGGLGYVNGYGTGGSSDQVEIRFQ
jgi:hypothetical protein